MTMPATTWREPDDAELAAIVRSMRTVAALGMKDESRAHEAAFAIPRVLQEMGVRVIPVNPRIEAALGETAWPRLADVPDRFDLVDVFRRREFIAGHADEILALPPERRPRVVWLQSGIRDDASAVRLEAAGIRVVQDACLGVIATRYRTRGEPGQPPA